MDFSTRTVSPLRHRMLEDMRMRKFEPKTQSSYLRAVRNLAAFLKTSPDTASAEDRRRFQLYMVEQGTSPITPNATISGLRPQMREAVKKAYDAKHFGGIHNPTLLEYLGDQADY